MDTFKIFCSYAPQDRPFKKNLHNHLRMVLALQNTSISYSDSILPGSEWEREHARQVQEAHIILLLVSADFLAVHELYTHDVLPAMQRYARGEVRIIPIILRPVHWQETPFGQLLPLPDGGKPVTDGSWQGEDHAFYNVVDGIKRAITETRHSLPTQPEGEDAARPDSTDDTATAQTDSSTQEDATVEGSARSAREEATAQLTSLIEQFRYLRKQIADYGYLKGPQGFTLTSAENQYNKLYGETMVFLAAYLPSRVSGDAEGFVETVQRQTAAELHDKTNPAMYVTRLLIPHLDKLMKLALLVDACIATLTLYKQKDLS